MKKFLFLSMATLVALIAFSCKKVSTRPESSVRTESARQVTDRSALLNGSFSMISTADLDAASVYFLISKKGDVPSNGSQKVTASRDGKNFSGKASNLAPSTVYYYKALADVKGKTFSGQIVSFVTSEELVPVDLGIVVNGKSIKWANRNLGAGKPEEYGDYYAWGETEPYYTEGHSQDDPCSHWRSRTNPVITGYNFTSYKWCNGSSSTFTRYNTDSAYGTVDNKTEFKDYDYVDDPACAALDGKWRTPTAEEWGALLTSCGFKRISDYNGTGVSGCIVTSKVTGYTDNSIFLPDAGYRGSAKLFNKNSFGYYWSSSLYTDAPASAIKMFLGSVNVSVTDELRYMGISVRPVCE